ncbi:hypothetical protein D3C84_931160 [compost metagenome]
MSSLPDNRIQKRAVDGSLLLPALWLVQTALLVFLTAATEARLVAAYLDKGDRGARVCR